MTDLTIRQPDRGTWPWRELLPANLDELTELRRRALAAVAAEMVPQAVADRFIGWAWAEMETGGAGGRAPGTESAYRRLLAELVADHPLSGPKRRRRARRDAGLSTVNGALVSSSVAGAVAALSAGRAVLVPVAILGAVLAASRGSRAAVESAPRIPDSVGFCLVLPPEQELALAAA